MSLGPRCFKWKILSLSGPKALLFLQLLIALLTRYMVNVCAFSKDFLFVSLVTNRVSLEEVCLPRFDVLNCWLNMAAMSHVLDKTPEPRVPLIHALTATTPHPDPTPALPSPSHSHSTHTCNTNNSTCIPVTATTSQTDQ